MDLWLARADPLSAINHALEEALDDLTVPRSTVGRRARTTVTKVGALGASIELGREPERRALPAPATLRLDALAARVAQAAGRPLLLLLDEIQTLAEPPDGAALVAALRAVLQKRHDTVLAVFTGSSQEALAAMMTTAGAPMYQFAQLVDFPPLGTEYLAALAAHFNRVHKGAHLAPEALVPVFERLGRRPALMKDVVKEMSAEGSTDAEAAVKRLVGAARNADGWAALLAALPALDALVLAALAHGAAPFSRATIAALDAAASAKVTLAKVRAALERLRAHGLIASGSARRSGSVIDDPLLVEYLRATMPPPAHPGAPAPTQATDG